MDPASLVPQICLPKETQQFLLDISGLHLSRNVNPIDIFTILSVAIAALLFVFSVFSFNKTLKAGNQNMKSAHYSELDSFYAELLKMPMTYPFLRNPAPIAHDDEALKADYNPYPDLSEDDRIRYDCYALMIWNFIEAIHDRCQELREAGDRKNYKALRDTWSTIIAAENRIHRGWFLSEMRNQAKLEWHAQQASQSQRPQPTEADKSASAPEPRSQAREAAEIDDLSKFQKPFRVFVYERQWREQDWTYREAFKQPIDYAFAGVENA